MMCDVCYDETNHHHLERELFAYEKREESIRNFSSTLSRGKELCSYTDKGCC